MSGVLALAAVIAVGAVFLLRWLSGIAAGAGSRMLDLAIPLIFGATLLLLWELLTRGPTSLTGAPPSSIP